MARLVRIQFKVDEFHLTHSIDKVFIYTKSDASSYTRKSCGVKDKISDAKAAFYVDFPQPPHAQGSSAYVSFALSIVAEFHRQAYSTSVVVDAINVVETDRTPDTPQYTTQELDNLEKAAIQNHTIEEIVSSPTIINGTNVSENGQRFNDGTSRREILFNITYNELSSMPVIADPGPTWVDPSSLVSYSISNSLVGCTTSNDATSVSEGSSYSATITASTGYHFEVSDVTITMGSNTITPTFAQDYKSFTISIPSVTSSVSISATATYDTPVSTYYTITNELTQCTTNNAATQVPEGSSYSAKLTANAGYYFYTGNVVITMGSTSITPTLNKNGSYNVSIAEVTGNVVITALASAEAPTPSVWSARWEEIPTPNSSFDVVSSSIHQTADKIELKVSSEDLVSTLNSQLTIQSNLIHLYSDGKIVIEGDNFELDANGHMTAVGATLKSENSRQYGITITDGKISFTYRGDEGASIEYSGYDNGSALEIGVEDRAWTVLNGVMGMAIFYGSNFTSLGNIDGGETRIYGSTISIQHPNDGLVYDLGYVEGDTYSQTGGIDGLSWDVDYNTGYVYNLEITSRHSFFY